MELPNKQLLSVVLGVNVKDIYKLGSNPNLDNSTLPYSIKGCGDLEEINIYELAHKCKEWAFNENYIISSELHFHSACVAIYNNNGLVLDNNNNDCIIESTEPEAIFKACQWILEQRND